MAPSRSQSPGKSLLEIGGGLVFGAAVIGLFVFFLPSEGPLLEAPMASLRSTDAAAIGLLPGALTGPGRERDPEEVSALGERKGADAAYEGIGAVAGTVSGDDASASPPKKRPARRRAGAPRLAAAKGVETIGGAGGVSGPATPGPSGSAEPIPLPIEWKVKKRRGKFKEEPIPSQPDSGRRRGIASAKNRIEDAKRPAIARAARGEISPPARSIPQGRGKGGPAPAPLKPGEKKKAFDPASLDKVFGKLPIDDFIGCYDHVSNAAMHAEEVKALQNRGSLICWKTPEGKQVYQFDDGSLIDGTWYKQAIQAYPGAARRYQDELGGDPVGQKPLGYRTRVMSYLSKRGAYVNTFRPAWVPDAVHWVVYFKGNYRITFDYGNSRDCIFSGNGIYVLSGPEGSINIPAQGCGEYLGHKTCIRCDLGCRW